MESQAYEELYRQEPSHWWYRGMRHISQRLLSTVLNSQRSSNGFRILDAGCGVGGNLIMLAAFGMVIGFDYSRLALTYANSAHSGKLVQATVEALPYSDRSFDLVTSFDVLYCREVSDDARALAECARVLRPGGIVFVRVPALPILRGSHDEVVHGVRRYTAQELRSKLREVGLMPIRLTYLNCLLLPLIFLIRRVQVLRRRVDPRASSDVRSTLPIIDTLLFHILKSEAWWITGGRNFPAGVSVICLAAKPVE